MKNTTWFLGLILLISCGEERQKADAYGNFESTVITISAQANGLIQQLHINEGKKLDSGQVVGWIDTTDLHLQKQQLLVRQSAVMSKQPSIRAKIDVLQEELRIAQQELERFQPLAEEGAVPAKKVDDIKDRIAVIKKQIESIRTQDSPILQEARTIAAQIKILDHQMQNAMLTVPRKGTVLNQIRQKGEFVRMGSPVFQLSDLDTLILKAYLSGDQLSEVKLGEKVSVRIDGENGQMTSYEGVIRHMAEEAEFTPQSIQTKENRVDMVYATEIAVPNDGKLKVGMPGEVYFYESQKE